MITALAVIFGLLIGSFLNVCIYRWPLDLSILSPARSFCPSCEKQIAWYDNIPLLSYVLLRGRCRNCGAGIRFRYPLVELLTGLFWGLAAYVYGPTFGGLKFALLAALLIALFFSDLEERILPDELTKTGIVLGLIFATVVHLPTIVSWLLLPSTTPAWAASLADAAVSSLFFGGMLWGVGEMYYRLRHREGLGFGDVKLIAMIGAFLGLQATVMTLMIGSLSGAVLGLVFILLTKQDSSTYELPYGSFLSASGLAVATWLGPYMTLTHNAINVVR